MNPTNPYWTPSFKYKASKYLKPITNRGFSFNIPWPDVTTAGYYYGSGAVPGVKKLVFKSDPEYFATQNIVPSSAGIPRINPYDPIYHFEREKHTVRF